MGHEENAWAYTLGAQIRKKAVAIDLCCYEASALK